MTDEGDQAQIRALVDGYAAAADARDAQGFTSVFATDGVLIASPTSRYEGHAALSTVPGKLERYDRTRHVIGEHATSIDADHATAETACTAHHEYLDDDGRRCDRVMHLRYADQFVRTPDGWRIAERTLVLDHVDDGPIPT